MKRLPSGTSQPNPGSGRQGCKRHRKVASGSYALSKPAIRRLARRAGVKRINGEFYDHVQPYLRSWLGEIIRSAAAFTEHARRMTVTTNDVLLALKRNGRTLYGFAERPQRRRITRKLAPEELQAAQTRVVQRQQEAAAAREHEQQQGPVAVEDEAQQQQVQQAEEDLQLARRVQGEAQQSLETQGADKASSTPGPITPERSLEIQACLSDFQDTLQWDCDPEVLLPHAFQWVSTRLHANGRPACSQLEFDTVLTALERQNAIMLIEEGGIPRTVVFTT